MLLHRAGDIEPCPPGRISCPANNIVVSGNTDTDPLGTTPGPPPPTTITYSSKPGVHRFIGIGMVTVLVLIAFALWLRFAKYPRRKLAAAGWQWGWCGPRPKPADSAASGDAPGAGNDDAEAQRAEKGEKERERERERARNQMLQAEPRGVIKEVSGGVVMYTEVPRPPALVPRSRDRVPTGEWAFEHVHGVVFEVSRIYSMLCSDIHFVVIGRASTWLFCDVTVAAKCDLGRSSVTASDDLLLTYIVVQARSHRPPRSQSSTRPRS